MPSFSSRRRAAFSALISAGETAGIGIAATLSASCTDNGSDTGRDVSPDGTDMPSASVTNRVRVAAGKAAKSASQYWTHRDLKTLTQRYDRVQQPFAERICAENNEHLFNYHIPQATNADF
jgi:hypothetical protein